LLKGGELAWALELQSASQALQVMAAFKLAAPNPRLNRTRSSRLRLLPRSPVSRNVGLPQVIGWITVRDSLPSLRVKLLRSYQSLRTLQKFAILELKFMELCDLSAE